MYKRQEYDIASCCKRLRLSKNIVEMSVKIQADSHQEYLLKLLQAEITHREKARRDKLLKKAGFYTIKTFESFRSVSYTHLQKAWFYTKHLFY